MNDTFTNEAPADFSIAEERQSHLQALSELNTVLNSSPINVYPILEGKEVSTAESYLRPDPSQSDLTVAKVYLADETLAQKAIQIAQRGFKTLETAGVEKRCQWLKQAALLMQKKRKELFALMVREAGKPWKESDADVCEAIDFLNYYAEQMQQLSRPYKTAELAGEDNFHSYKGKGIAVVISPWNFPLAITCGMTAAALVAGNSVILKPSRQTSAIAKYLVNIFLEAGIPADALSFLPSAGSVVGRILVKDPNVHIYVFTGSKEVGLEIIEQAAKVLPGQRHVKKVIAEMGGKNVIIVDEDADLDEAVKGIVYSAFGFSGQKCSACSRLLVVGSAYEPLMERLKEATSDIITGKASDPGTLLGPVIDKASQERILATISDAEKKHSLLVKKEVASNGFFIPACIFKDVDSGSEIWNEEIFGPVLACRKAENFEEALTLANDCQYALTAGLYSRSPVNIQKAKDLIEAGNFYINRPCTGAIVQRHPFGGFKLSGIGSKAGGKDYLIQFLDPRLVSENTLRRGFSPE